MSDTERRCGTCAWWNERGAPSARAVRNNDARNGWGTCERAPPNVVGQAGIPISYFPETATDRRCGEWKCAGGDGGDDGERAGGGEVVPIRSMVA